MRKYADNRLSVGMRTSLEQSAWVNIRNDLAVRSGTVRAVLVEVREFWGRVLTDQVVEDIIADVLRDLSLSVESEETLPDPAVKCEEFEGHA